MNPSKAVVVLVGPTGSGKTAVALHLARRLDAEVISADSRQVYRRLSAGTAKPDGEWRNDARHPLGRYYDVDGVPHHLLDVLDPTETFSAADFARRAETVLAALSAAGRRAILAGGTGLYLKALVDGLAPLPARDEALRRELTDYAASKGRPALHAELARVDPDAAARIPPNNIARVVRALEVFRLTGRPLSRWQKEETRPSARRFAWFGLRWPKDALRRRLDDRCAAMVPGLLRETSSLLREGLTADAPAFQPLGYREAVRHLRGELTRAAFEELFRRATRAYVKRQLTWFGADRRVAWLDVREPFDAAALAADLARALPRGEN
jgi:tRNA dimethylallyltransferase